MKLVLIVLHIPIWVFLSVHASLDPDPFVASISGPVASPSPPVPLIPSVPASSSTMAASSPGIGVASQDHHMESHKKLVVALVVACTAMAAVILSLLCLWVYCNKFYRKSQKKNAQSSAEEGVVALAPFMGKFNSLKMAGKKGSVSFLDYKQLEKATGGFSDDNILGVGGFGCVYKARLDENFDVAVKKLDCENQVAEKEFENEVGLLSKMQHPNIISLLGCSSYGDKRFVVYELMQNGSLEKQLHGTSHGSALTWPIRMKIALDVARGLEYLHEHCRPQVIHRDLKTSNILLDSNFNAKISDFGLAVTDVTQNKSNIKLSGTLGYLAPEYLLDGKLTDKSDVYAFGVVLLELLLGRKPVEKLAPAQCQSIITWAMPQLTDRSKLPNIVDPVIKDTMDLKHLYQVAAVAVLCVQPEPSYRPLITDVLHSLVPLVPFELGGTLRTAPSHGSCVGKKEKSGPCRSRTCDLRVISTTL